MRGVVGGAALAGTGATGSALVQLSTSPTGRGGGVREYFGIELTDGPAPRGMPVIPVRIADDRFERLLADPVAGRFVEAAAPDGFLAWLNKCTHFCCVPGYEQSAQAAAFDAEDGVYCPCHQSVYDPFSVVQESFVALPRPDE